MKIKDGKNQKSKGGTVLVLEFTAPESFSSLVCESTIQHYHSIFISTTFFQFTHLNGTDVRASVGNTTWSFHILLLSLCPPLPTCQQGCQNIFTLLSNLIFALLFSIYFTVWQILSSIILNAQMFILYIMFHERWRRRRKQLVLSSHLQPWRWNIFTANSLRLIFPPIMKVEYMHYVLLG